MIRFKAWLSAMGLLLLVSAAIALALASLVPSSPELARRAEAALGDALGVPVTVRALRWHVWPVPRLVIDDVATVQPQPIRLTRLTLYAGMPQSFSSGQNLASLIRIDRAELDGAELPQLSLPGLGQAHADEAPRGPSAFDFAGASLVRLVFRDVNWVSRSGHALRYEGEMDFDDDWRPRTAQLRQPGAEPVAALQMTRRGVQNQWDVFIELAHGSARGQILLETGADKRLRLEGTLQAHQIDAPAAAGMFGLQPLLAGRVSGHTALWADGTSPGELARRLQTRSTFSFSAARLLQFDLDQALRTGGRDTEGETPLGPLTGQLDTYNTGQGVELNFSALKAEAHGDAGPLAVSGRMRVSPVQRVDAQFEVELLAGIIGQPLQISGPLDKLTVTIPRSAAAGKLAGSAARALSP